jgi:azurin
VGDHLSRHGNESRKRREAGTMKLLFAAAALLLLCGVAAADPCHVSIEANDMMQFNTRSLAVPASCAEIEVTLRNVGKQPARIMGHNWVLSRDSDVTAIASAGIAAGFGNDYQPPADKRIIAATKIVGGGESATTRINTALLQPGGSYMFFCSAPGHASLMKGKFLFGAPGELRAENKPVEARVDDKKP